jgi:hypothetical protein
MILRLLSPQGVAGLAASLALAILLILSKADARHWKKQSSQFEQLYRGEQAAFAGTVANYRAAAQTARAADQATAKRVAAEQSSINQRSAHDYESRLAAARAAAQRLRVEAAAAAADPGSRAGAPVPRVAAAAAGAAQAAGQDRLPPSDALTATEQAIQLDELVKWVRAQHEVATNR